MKFWRTGYVEVQMADDFDRPLKQASIDHVRSVIVYEDPGSLEEFYNDARHFLELLYQVFPTELRVISRVGVRSISVLEATGCSDFKGAFDRVMASFFSAQSHLELRITDCQAILDHEAGKVVVGPVREGQLWLKQSFSVPDRNVPPIGFGVDIDSFKTDAACESSAEASKVFSDVLNMTLSTEDQVAALLIVEGGRR